jgi:hypothetical protein
MPNLIVFNTIKKDDIAFPNFGIKEPLPSQPLWNGHNC